VNGVYIPTKEYQSTASIMVFNLVFQWSIKAVSVSDRGAAMQQQIPISITNIREVKYMLHEGGASTCSSLYPNNQTKSKYILIKKEVYAENIYIYIYIYI